MNRPTRSLFLDLVRLAGAVPLAACASVVTPVGDGETANDTAIVDASTSDTTTCRQHMAGSTGCGQSEIWPCGLPVMVPTGTFQSGATCDMLCPDFVGQASYSHSCSAQAADASGSVTVTCAFCRAGRRPEGWTLEQSVGHASPLGEFFAAFAQLEAASIPAFRALVRDLEAHGAPTHMVSGARAAIRDERNHTRLVAALARRFGARPRAPRVNRTALNSVEALAVHNAVEGCVGETFGALLATFQAQNTCDEQVRATMSVIASDETRHANLACDVALWADARIDHAARERVVAARRRALRSLGREIAVEPHDDVRTVAGIPSAQQASVLFNGLAAAIDPAFATPPSQPSARALD